MRRFPSNSNVLSDLERERVRSMYVQYGRFWARWKAHYSLQLLNAGGEGAKMVVAEVQPAKVGAGGKEGLG